VKASDKDFLRKFETSIPLGLPILLEGVGEQLDPILEPLLEKRTTRSAGGLTLEFGEQQLDYQVDFQLYMTSKLSNPHFLPEVSTKVAVINFVITYEGLTEQLLDRVVQKENTQLDEE
jgi:dynein heavy chain